MTYEIAVARLKLKVEKYRKIVAKLLDKEELSAEEMAFIEKDRSLK